MPECPFCKIVKGETPALIVYEDEKFLAFLDINPATKGHTLVIPKEHYERIYRMDQEEVAGLFQVVQIVAKGLRKTFNLKGLNIIQNNGKVAGQRTPHVFVHIIPRRKEKEVIISYEPEKIKRDEASKTVKKLRNNIRGKREKIKRSKPKKPKPKPESEEEKEKVEREKIHFEEWT